MIVEVHPEYPQPRRIAEVAARLRSGALIAYPTDTIYAVGCATTSKKAVEALQRLKSQKRTRDRKNSKAMSIIVPDMSTISEWAVVDDRDYRLMKRATPGPFTFILRATRKVPKVMLNRQKTIGVRIPDAPVALALAEHLGSPIITMSASNEDGELIATPRDLEAAYRGAVEVVLDAGMLYPEPSTVIDLTGRTPEVVRIGKGSLDDLGLMLD